MLSTGYSILGEFHHLDGLDRFLTDTPCDVIVSEMRISGNDLFESCTEILDKHSKTKLIVYTYDENPTHIARASAIDAWDYIPKRYPVQRLVQACESTLSGQRHPDSLIGTVKQFLTHPHQLAESIPVSLTRREHQILLHLSLGLSNREISRSLKISLETVKEHVQNVLRKLQINDRTAAAIWSLRNGVPTFKFDAPP